MNFEANKFLETPAFNEKVEEARKRVEGLPYMLKLILFFIFVMVSVFILFYIITKFGVYMGCENSLTTRTSPTCIFVADIQATLVEHHGLLLKAFTAQIVALIVYAGLYITNVIAFIK